MQFIRHGLQIVVMLFMATAAYAGCQEYPAALQAMPMVDDQIINADGDSIDIRYRLAETSVHQAAGFQHVCPDTIQRESILFVFQRAFVPTFHMRNVYAPLDIGFFDDKGVLVDVQTMRPYSLIDIQKPRYRPKVPARYALEARQGFFAELGIDIGAQLTSRRIQPE